MAHTPMRSDHSPNTFIAPSLSHPYLLLSSLTPIAAITTTAIFHHLRPPPPPPPPPPLSLISFVFYRENRPDQTTTFLQQSIFLGLNVNFLLMGLGQSLGFRFFSAFLRWPVLINWPIFSPFIFFFFFFFFCLLSSSFFFFLTSPSFFVLFCFFFFFFFFF